MTKKFTLRSSALLFIFAILGLTLASVFYITPSGMSHAYTPASLYQRICGILLPLTLAFGFGFFELRLCSLSLLTLLRFFSLTLSCYLQFSQLNLRFLGLLLFSGMEGFLFLSFCRLSCLFGHACQADPKNKPKYIRQFIGDYLFHCGICTLPLLLCLI